MKKVKGILGSKRLSKPILAISVDLFQDKINCKKKCQWHMFLDHLR